MSTQISITVDRGGLLERNREQAQANRLAAQEAVSRRQLDQSSRDLRESKFAAEGRNSDSTPRGNSSRYVPLRDEVAAYRLGGDKLSVAVMYYENRYLSTGEQQTAVIAPRSQQELSYPTINNALQITPFVFVNNSSQTAVYDSIKQVSSFGQGSAYYSQGSSWPNVIWWSGQGRTTGEVIESLTDFGEAYSVSGLLPVKGDTAIYFEYGHKTLSYRHSLRVVEWQLDQNGYFVQGSTQLVEEIINKVEMQRSEYFICTLVNADQVKNLSFPEPLLANLRRLIPFPETEQRQFYGGLNWNQVDYLTIPVYTSSIPMDYAYDPDSGSYISYLLLQQYGFGDLDSGSHGYGEYYSPAMFTFIREYNGELTTPDAYDYNYIANQYGFSGSPASVTTYLDDDQYYAYNSNTGQLDIVQSLLYTKVRPSNFYERVDYSSLKESKNKKLTYARPTQNNLNQLKAWDWGQPAYCRSQLLNLGFTDNDLSFS